MVFAQIVRNNGSKNSCEVDADNFERFPIIFVGGS